MNSLSIGSVGLVSKNGQVSPKQISFGAQMLTRGGISLGPAKVVKPKVTNVFHKLYSKALNKLYHGMCKLVKFMDSFGV